MKDAQKPDHVSLNTLVNYLRDGRFVIPDFQREFEWKPWDVRELMRSIFLDYYIGSLLLWHSSARRRQSRISSLRFWSMARLPFKGARLGVSAADAPGQGHCRS